jgi:hypothetical protein
MDLTVLTDDGAEPLTMLAGAANPPMVVVNNVVLLSHRSRDLDQRRGRGARPVTRRAAQARRHDRGKRSGCPWSAHRPMASELRAPRMALHPDALPAVAYPQSGCLDCDQLAAAPRPAAQSQSLIGVGLLISGLTWT